IGLVDLREVFVTHFHADHYLGLPGMLKTFALRGRDVPLTLYGPPGLRELYSALRQVFGRLTYPVDLVEVRAGDTLERDGYKLLVFPVAHGTAAVGDALVVAPGRERGALQRGDSITLDDGRVLTPDAVLGPPRSGRTIVYPGDTA